MALVRSWTSSTSPKSTGRPRTNSAPMIGPATEPRPPITAVAIMRSEPSGVKVCGRVQLDPQGDEQGAGEGGHAPERAKATSFMRVDEIGGGRRHVLVLVHGDHRAAEARCAAPGP